MPHNLVLRVTSLEPGLVKDFKNIEVQTEEVPTPGDGEVLVRIKLRPVNPTDLIKAAGGYPGVKVPFAAGSEGVGVVEANGPGASKFAQGARVVGGSFGAGTWQQFIAVPEANLLAVPDAVDDKTAAQFYVNPLTVVGMVDVSEVPQGKYLLHGAAGSVLGRQLIQYAKHVGVKTINIVRRPEHVQELKHLGADEVIDSSTEDILERVHEITGGEGAWAALDPIAGDFTSTALRCVRAGGWVRTYGALSGSKINIEVMDILLSGRKLTGFYLGSWLNADGAEKKQKRLLSTLKLLEDKVITPLSGRTYELEQVREAMAASKEAGRGAKIFLSG